MPYDIKELYPDQIFKEWEASATFGDERALVCGGGFALQAGQGGDIFDDLPLGRPGDVAEDGVG